MTMLMIAPVTTDVPVAAMMLLANYTAPPGTNCVCWDNSWHVSRTRYNVQAKQCTQSRENNEVHNHT
jgi:hypothetical protein